MKKYSKLITLSVVLVLIITLITLAMIFDVDLYLFKNLSIAGIQEKKIGVEDLIQKQAVEEANNAIAKTTLQKSKNSFDVAKETYENIDESTIAIVQEATKEENYFIEYLWIVLGNYASANNLAINILTPGSTVATEDTTQNEKDANDETANTQNGGDTTTDKTEENKAEESIISSDVTALANGVKIVVNGRYADVADFVFEVENDKSLKFKLDNIKMNYSGDNKISATFDVLSLSVLQ